MRMLVLPAAALLALAGCSGGIPSSSTIFLNSTAYGVKVGQGASGVPEFVLGSASANTAIVPNEGSTGERLSSVYEAGAQGDPSWGRSEDGLSVFSCAGSDSILGRDNDVGIDAIYATGNAAGYAARLSRCSVGE